MQEQRTGSEQVERPLEVTLRLDPNAIVPDDAQIAVWHDHLSDQRNGQVYYCLGVLKASVEGAARAIERGDEQLLTLHVRLGLAVMAAEAQITAEQTDSGAE